MSIEELLSHIPYKTFIGNIQVNISDVIQSSSDNTNPNALMWISVKNIDLIPKIKTGIVIIPEGNEQLLQKNCQYIISENPRLTFAASLNILFPKQLNNTIEKTAIIASDVKLGNNVGIGHHVIIEANCTIGDNTVIEHNTVIKKGTIIASNCYIGSNCTIGGNGFGYEKDSDGDLQLIKHIGNVIIEEYVEIGNNTCIDRAVLGSTLIKKHVKIDNLVHIAHGVIIDENSLIIANSLIGGSTKIGKRVWVAPSATIINKTTIDDDALIGMGAVVIKPVQKGEVIIGNPGKPLQKK